MRLGRASNNGVFRALLWDAAVAVVHQGQWLGQRIVDALLAVPAVRRAERVYLMTNRTDDNKLGFHGSHGQLLLRLDQEQGQGPGLI